MSATAQKKTDLMGPPMPPGPIGGPSAWHGGEMAKSDEWIYALSAREIAEIDAALDGVKRRKLEILNVSRAEFPLPTLGPALDRIHQELLHGRGFTLIRGIPRQTYSTADMAMIFWGIGAYFGRAVSQNAKGHVLGHVRDLGYRIDDPSVRTYQTTRRQYYHADSCDFVALMCLQKARSGGYSTIVSSVTLYNEMLARDPALTRVLFEPFCVDRRGEVPPGMKPYYTIPVFNWHAGLLTSYYVRRYIDSAQRFEDVPRFADAQLKALDLLDSLADDPSLHLQMEFEPGDIQILHNHQILHDRTAFEDWLEPERKRHLLRLWLCPPDGRPMPEVFTQRWGSVEIGNRGGIRVAGATLNAPLEPV
jgi:Taurine catabolism dioxygenase TauD, TfdA family